MSKEGSSEEVAQEGGAANEAGKKDPNADLYENRSTKKVVRLVTVVAYVFSVSFVAIVLSAYYLFLWEPPDPRLLHRPVHFSSEPEVQFLISDPLEDPPIDHGDSLKITLTSRTLDDDRRQSSNDHEKLDQSLFLLRNSLVEFLQRKINDSAGDSSKKKWYPWHDREEKLEKSNVGKLKDGKTGETMGDRVIRDNNASLTLDSSTISGDEVNEDRFTNTRKSDVLRNSTSDRKSMKNPIVDAENIPSSFLARATADRSKKNVRMDAFGDKSRSAKIDSSGEKFTNTAKTAPTINDSTNILTTGNSEIEKDHRNGGLRSTSESSVDSIRDADVSKSTDPSFASLINIAINLKDTQIETTTTKLGEVANVPTDKTEMATAQKQKDLLSILANSTDVSSTVSPPFTTSDSFQTESTTEDRESFSEKLSDST